MNDYIAIVRDKLLNRGISSTIMTGTQLAVVGLWLLILISSIANGQWRQLWVVLILMILLYGAPMLIYRLVTKKTATVDVQVWGAYGLEWGKAEIELEKTEEEKAEDASFLNNLFPVIPIMMFMVLAIFMTMSGDGNEAGPIGSALIFSIIASISLYFGFKWVRHSEPTSLPMQILQGIIKGVVFAPHTFFMIGGVIGIVTGILALVI